jgi:hypothetical protein
MSHPGFLQELSVSKIHHPVNQLRIDLDNVQDLALSIKQHGLLQPIVVRPKEHQYEVVARKDKAMPFDLPNVELGHHAEECSFDAIIKKYELDKKEPALNELAKIVRGADTDNRKLTPYS